MSGPFGSSQWMYSSGVAGFYGHEIGGSLRFNRSTTTYLSRTFGTPSTDGEKCFTISVWVKRAGNTGNNNYILDGHTSNEHVLAFEGDLLRLGAYAGSDQFNIKTNTRKLRDSTAWYHIVCAVDTRKAIAQERVIFYINGEQLPSSELQGTYPAQNFTGRLNVSGNTAQIGRWGQGTGREFEGYMAEFHFIDAQQKTADDFGEFNSGAWIPKAYSGTHGNNGFHLDMIASNFSGVTLSDSSGNSNNWTASGGIDSHDFVLDSCTNNFSVWNYWNAKGTLSQANLQASTSDNNAMLSTFSMPEGKWYWEVMYKSGNAHIGIGSDRISVYDEGINSTSAKCAAIYYDGRYYKNGSQQGTAASLGSDDIVAMTFDSSTRQWTVYKNNSSTSEFTLTLDDLGSANAYAPALGSGGTPSVIGNFGQDSTFAGSTAAGGNTDENDNGDFKYAVPSGFLALCTANLPDPAIDPANDAEPRDYFETFLYSGNGGGLQVGDVIKKPADTTTISNSLIFNDDDSAYLSRTHTLGNRKTWTWSGWVKRGNLGTGQRIFHASTDSNNRTEFYFRSDDQIEFFSAVGGVHRANIKTNAKLRDSSAWYHLVVKFDAANTSLVIYINGVSQTLTTTTAVVNTDHMVNSTNVHTLGQYNPTGASYLDGYLAEVHFIDGTAYDADNFGNFDANGIWIPKTVTGITYGTNGFYLNFSDNTSTTTLGEDQAGSNDWTLNNFATTDQVPDSPTNSYPIFSGSNKNSGTQLSEGNLEFRNTAGQHHNSAIATQRLPKQGKWYWEAKVITDSSPATNAIGIVSSSYDNTPTPSGAGNYFYNEGLGWYGNTGGLFGPATYGDEVESGSATTFGNNDIIGVEYDADEKTMYFRKNGTLIDYHYINIKDSAYDFLPATSAYGDLAGNGTRGNIINFGQKTLYGTDGAGTLPTGFSLLTEDNITVDDQNLESPDFVWIKSRSNGAHSHQLYDSVRGATKRIFSDDVSSELDAPNGLQSFNKNGFTVGSREQSNTAGDDYVAWTWKANGSGVDSSSNMGGAGTGASATTSADTDAGIGITKYFIGSSPDTYKAIPHGLGATPQFIIVKNLDDGEAPVVHHHKLGANGYFNLALNTNGEANSVSVFRTGLFDSTTFTVGGSNETGKASTNFIAYCFVGKEGFSKFGIYDEQLDGSDYDKTGPFIYCGFRPAWIFIRSTSAGRSFAIYDNKRTPVNPAFKFLLADTAGTEGSNSTNMDIDFMANGFKIKGGDGTINTTNEDYVFAAFAEMPFKYATAR